MPHDLDGIVTIGGDDAIAILREACKSGDTREKQSFLQEAIEQLGSIDT